MTNQTLVQLGASKRRKVAALHTSGGRLGVNCIEMAQAARHGGVEKALGHMGINAKQRDARFRSWLNPTCEAPSLQSRRRARHLRQALYS